MSRSSPVSHRFDSPSGWSRRTITQFGLALIAGTVTSSSAWAAFPEKPIRLVVSGPPGGTSDLIARLLGEYLSHELHQPFVVESRTGANGAIAAEYVAKSSPDGHTLLLATPAFASNNAFNPDSRYDPIRDFAPIGTIGETPAVLLVPSSAPYTTVTEFVAAAKRDNQPLAYGSAGVGSSNHLNAESFQRLVGLKAQHVPYRGDTQVITDLIGGQIQFAVLNAPGALPLIRAGKLRALGSATGQRSPSLPDVPTLTEAGVKLVASSWFFLVGPRATETLTIQTLNAAMQKVLADPGVRKRFVDLACDPHPTGAPEAAALLTREVRRAEQIAANS